MRTSYDNGLTYSKAPEISGADYAMREPAANSQSPEMLSAIWRYRGAVILPAVIGAMLGFLLFLKLPEVFRSTTRLIVESDRATILDPVTGEMVGGVPGIEIVESQLFSDKVISTAFNDPRMEPYRGQFENGLVGFTAFVIGQKALVLEPEVTDLLTASAVVTLLHFDSQDKEFSEVAVQCFSEALQKYYNEKHKSSRNQLITYMETATQQLYPQMEATENEYRSFRERTLLSWTPDGKALNPHRERQVLLVKNQSELVEELRQTQTEHAAVKIALENASNSEVALAVVGQVLGRVNYYMPDNQVRAQFGQEDEQLALVKVEEELIPLMVQRNSFASQFGENHPTVNQLDLQIEMVKKEMGRIMTEQTKRIGELLEGGSKRSENASSAVTATMAALDAKIDMLESQVVAVNQQILQEQNGARELAKAELEHEALLRRMERQRDLMNQVEEQMTRVSLTEEESGTRVTSLTAPSRAGLVAPTLVKTVGLGGFAGLTLGIGLALLLEKNANTFRDPDEIAEFLGAAVLTHVPFFKPRLKRARKGEDESPFKDLDPGLAVLHQPASIVSEAIRSCRTSVMFETAGIEGGRVLQVTSPLPGDGKTTLAGNLACSLAQSGKRVLMIDCDLRRPQLTDNFSMQDKLGLSNILNGDCEPSEACHPTPLAKLSVIPSGPIPANPAEALTLPEMVELLDLLRDEYDFIVVDTPPLLVVTDPSIIASLVDGVVLALRVRRKSKPNARESVNILRAVGAKLLGVVINNSDEAGTSDGYKGYGYYRYRRYANRFYGRSEKGKTESRNGKAGRPVVVSGRGIGEMPKPAELSDVVLQEDSDA